MEGDVDGSDTSDIAPFEYVTDDETMDEAANGRSIEENQTQHTFDTLLPMRHSYLGPNLEELRGRTLLDDDSYQTIPILEEPGVILVPGQTLPLTIFYPPAISMLRRAITTDRTIGVVCILSRPPSFADIGTTAEIYEFQDDDEIAGIFKIKAKGRQRFKILETHRQIDGNVTARVRILPEIILTDPLAAMRSPSLDRHRRSLPLKRLRLDKQDAIVTRWPSWVHSQYQFQKIVSKLMEALSHLQLGNVVLPTDPVELSFWLAQSLPLQDQQRLTLLKIDCAIQRLRWELSVLEKCRVLCCQKCSIKIAYQRDVFSMSVEGPQGMYVNSGGYVHEIMTVYKAKDLKCVSEAPSTEFSWFPGYAWSIVDCSRCHSHIGWLFTATQPELKPVKFWGLCRRSLVPKLQADEDVEVKPVM